MSGVVGQLALTLIAAGVVLGLVVTVRLGLRYGVSVLLDLLLAAGLVRLSGRLGWEELGGVSAIVVLRHLVSSSLRLSARELAAALHAREPA